MSDDPLGLYSMTKPALEALSCALLVAIKALEAAEKRGLAAPLVSADFDEDGASVTITVRSEA